MADIKVEKRSSTPWGWIVLGALAVLALAWILFAAFTPDQPAGTIAERGVVTEEQTANMVVSYEGQEWIPASVDQTAQFNDEEMVVVGEQEGVLIYAHPETGLGGGGGDLDVPQGLETQPYGRIYLKMDDGSYLPMVLRSEVNR